jgi:hypothetical protein
MKQVDEQFKTTAEEAAERYGYVPIDWNESSKTISYANKDRVRLNLFLTTRTVGIIYPLQEGKKRDFVHHREVNDEMLVDIFANPSAYINTDMVEKQKEERKQRHSKKIIPWRKK